MTKKYPILEKAKKKAQKIRGAKGYSEYTPKQKYTTELEYLKAKVKMREHIYERISKIYEVELALLVDAKEELNKYLGEKAKKTTK